MPDLTHLDEKLAEVLGLAQAARQATSRVATLARDEDDDELATLMERMGEEAAETEKRCQEVADGREGMKTAIADKARETKSEVVEFMRTYLEDAEALDGLEFLTMSEAGELIHWEIVAKLNEKAGDDKLAAVIEATLPVQQRHVAGVREHALRLAADEDPAEEA